MSGSPESCSSASACRDGDGFGLDLVVGGAQRLAQSLADEQASVRDARARLAALRQRLSEQVAATEATQRQAFAARVRILQAEQAVAKARGSFPGPVRSETLRAVQEAAEAAREGVQELQAARRDRDAARSAALQLMTRVRALGDAAGGGAGALLQSWAACSRLVQRSSAALDQLRELHQSLMSICSSAAADVGADDTGPARDHLEARWIAMTASLDGLKEGKSKSAGAVVPNCSTTQGRSLLSETEKRSASLHQLSLDIQEVCSLLG